MVNKQLDPENDQFLVVSLIFQPSSARVELLIYWIFNTHLIWIFNTQW